MLPNSMTSSCNRWLQMRLGRGAVVAQLSRSEEHTSELQSHVNLVCRLLLEKKKNQVNTLDKPPLHSVCIWSCAVRCVQPCSFTDVPCVPRHRQQTHCEGCRATLWTEGLWVR